VSNPDGLLADDVILVQQLEAPDGIDRERFVADEAQAVHGSITKLNVNGLLLATSAARAVQLAFASNDEATVSALSAGLMVIIEPLRASTAHPARRGCLLSVMADDLLTVAVKRQEVPCGVPSCASGARICPRTSDGCPIAGGTERPAARRRPPTVPSA